MAKKLFVIDGMGQIFRCYYAPFQNLTAPNGEPTRATYVFTNMLLQLAREQKPDYLIMAMDSRDETTFRRNLAPDYKAHRDAPPEDLAPQIVRILEIVRSQNIPILVVPGFEADDIMATLAGQLCNQHEIEVYLVSKDKDLDQVVSDCIKLFDPGKNEVIGPAEIREKKGYGPEQAIEVQTLCGDTTDNIPGVKGVGPKKAAALIAKYGTAAEVIKHADELTPAMKANVIEFVPKLELTRTLVTLRQDVPLDFNIESSRWNGLNGRTLLPIVRQLGFTRLVQQLSDQQQSDPVALAPAEPVAQTRVSSVNQANDKEVPAPTPAAVRAKPAAWPSSSTQMSLFEQTAEPVKHFEGNEQPSAAHATQDDADQSHTATSTPCADRPPGHYICVDTPVKFSEFLAELKRQQIFAFDTETTGLGPVGVDLAGMSFAWSSGKAWYLPICGVGNCLSLEPTLSALRPIFADPNVKKIGQNLKYDIVVLAMHGVPVHGVTFDTMIASFVLDSSRRSHGMDALAMELLGRTTIPITELIGTGKSQVSFASVQTDRATDYAAEDADVTWQLYEVLNGQLGQSDLGPLFHETEMPLVKVLAAMEAEGVRLDCDVLKKMSGEIQLRLEALSKEIHREVGHEFNIDSTKQLADVLYDELKLPVLKSTAKKARSTDAETLDMLVEQTSHAVPRLVKEYRELVKLKGTYIDTLPTMICPGTGRIHTSFSQTTAITGRLSSSDPNLQNIPIRTELGRQIRRAFVARNAEHVLVTADYSQIELRVLAHYCRDDALRRAFAEDMDIHAFVAGQVFGVPIEQVSKEQRGRAKAVNFGIIYGQTAFGLSRTTGMSQTEAQSFIDMYFLRYPGIRLFIDQTIADARRAGHVRTILGRRRSVPDINSNNRNLRFAAERFAVNTVIQGSAADMIKRAMINIHRRIVDEKRPARMILQVHDELIFDIPRSAVESEAKMIREEMAHALPFDVPIKVDLNWGENWLEGK